MQNDEENKKLLGLIIKTEREKLKLTQEELCSKIELDQSNLSNIENGKNYPSFTTFCKIIEALNTEPNKLLRFLNFANIHQEKIDIEIQELLQTIPENTKQNIYELLKQLKTKQ